MDHEALDFMFQRGRESAATVLECKHEPPGVYYLRNEDGAISRVEAAPHPSKHTASSLQAIGELGEFWAGKCQAWIGAASIVLQFGDTKEHTATLSLQASEPLELLMQWARSKPAHTQQNLISYLRTTLRDSLPSTALFDSIKKVRFNSQSQVSGEVGHGRASIGKELSGEITGSAAIPEYVAFSVPVFANACFRHIRATVECALEPDASTGMFRVTPLPGEIADAADHAQQTIHDDLVKMLPAGTMVLLGSP